MATKTVVCPECGSAAAPGRYACSECGALLASVAAAPRAPAAGADETARAADDGGPVAEAVTAPGKRASRRRTGSLRPEPEPEPVARDAAGAGIAPGPVVDVRAEGPLGVTAAIEPGVAVASEPDSIAGVAPIEEAGADLAAVATRRDPSFGWARQQPDDGQAFDEDAPLASERNGHAPDEPDVLHDLAEPLTRDEPTGPAATPAWPTRGPVDTAAAPAWPPPGGPEPAAGAPAWPQVGGFEPAAGAPAWPPPGDRGPISRPAPRTPAGTYLPPSAVLPPLDLPPTNGGVAVVGPTAGVPDRSMSSRREAAAATWSERATAALSDAADALQVTTDAARRTVAAGAGLAVLGILLPWVNGLPGDNPFAGYFDRWGLGGPGMWLVLTGLVALAGVAGSSGRAASWPVRLPALGTAAFLVGLLWPYLVGGFGRSIGVWVVLVGAIAVAVGGLLDREGRNEDAMSSV